MSNAPTHLNDQGKRREFGINIVYVGVMLTELGAHLTRNPSGESFACSFLVARCGSSTSLALRLILSSSGCLPNTCIAKNSCANFSWSTYTVKVARVSLLTGQRRNGGLTLPRIPISLTIPATIRAVYAPRENPNNTS